MEPQNDLTPDSLAEEVDVASTDGTPEAASDVAQKAVEDATKAPDQPENPEGMSLEELNSFLGKQFKDKDSALKAIKDTFSYVGKAGKKPAGADSKEVAEIKNELFFVKNPSLDKHRDLLEAIAAKNDVSLAEAAGLDSFKSYVEKADGYEKTQAAKSVLQSNPKLGAVRDSMQVARDLSKAAAQSSDPFEAARIQSEAAEKATLGVIDAYGLE